MAEIKQIKRGLDIPIKGEAAGDIIADNTTLLFGICPDDFPGYSWRLLVKPDQHVDKGSPIFADKETGDIKIVSPVCGTVKEVVRGERRHILHVDILRDGDSQATLTADGSLIHRLCESGLWAFMRQRPYGIIPSPAVTPRDIFVTAFDTAPLAMPMLRPDDLEYLGKGLEALASLTPGKVYLGTRFGQGLNSRFAEVTEYKGPHPAGNVGVQIAATKPVNKGETVWALDAVTVARIGRFLTDGTLDFSTVVALTGSEMENRVQVATTIGASLKELLAGHLPADDTHIRIISGNVLTGIRENLDDGFLRYPYRQVTAIPEGDDAVEVLGWASLDPNRYSTKRSFPAFMRGLHHPFDFDARLKGGHRAMILSGEYDKVFPFDIYPEYLVKAALAHDIDKMEKLGIYEVVPEDFALPEFVDSSKIPLQQIIRDAINYMRENA